MTRIGAIAGAVAALVAFVYVIGGAVMWLRFRNVGLPSDSAVAQVPRSDLLVVGLRVMILPALAAGALLAGIALLRERRQAAQRTRLEALEAELAELPREPASDARRAQLEAEIAKDVADLSSAPGRRRATLALALLGALFVVLVLVLPITLGAIPWLDAVALAGYGIWATQFGHAPRKVSVWVLVAAAIACSGFISVARQFDHPIQLLGAGVQVSEDVRVTGVLVASTREEVTLGFPLTGVIKTYQRKDVMDINIGPALDRQAPARSLLSYVIARHDPWAITPFELWCGGERYGWTEIPKLAQSHPAGDTGCGRTDRPGQLPRRARDGRRHGGRPGDQQHHRGRRPGRPGAALRSVRPSGRKGGGRGRRQQGRAPSDPRADPRGGRRLPRPARQRGHLPRRAPQHAHAHHQPPAAARPSSQGHPEGEHARLEGERRRHGRIERQSRSDHERDRNCRAERRRCHE